jgi:hypothetical protein
MIPHADGGASAWDSTYATTSRFVLLFSKYKIKIL